MSDQPEDLDSANITPLNLNRADSNFNNHQDLTPDQTEISQPQSKEELKQEEQQIPYESLVLTLKKQSNELKKNEIFKKKIEERYKEKVKQLKDTQKEKTILEDFIKQVIPSNYNGKNFNVFDKEGKLLMDLETMIKSHAEIMNALVQQQNSANNQSSQQQQQKQPQNQQQVGFDDLLPLYKEENENLKRKIMDLTTMYKQEQQKNQALQNNSINIRFKEAERQIKGFEDLVKEKDEQIESLRNVANEYQEMKGKQLLQVIKTGKTGLENNQQSGVDSDELQLLKQQLSDKTNKILDLTEQLSLANQTINAIEESNKLKQSQVIDQEEIIKAESNDRRQSENNLKAYSQYGDDSLDEVQILRQRAQDLEQIKNDLYDQIEHSKLKARNLLIKKDVHIQKIKMVVQKFEYYLKNQKGLTQDEINKIGMLREEEIQRLKELEKDLEQEDPTSDWDEISSQNLEVLNNLDKQLVKNNINVKDNTVNAPGDEYLKNIEYIKNIFVKYLEYLAQNNMKQIGPLESILFNMLNLTTEDIQRLNLLRKQNTFWKKVIPFQNVNQPLMKNKFNASELKKKLFGGVQQFMSKDNLNTTFGFNGLPQNRPSISRPTNDMASRGSITSQLNTMGVANLNDSLAVDDFKMASDLGQSPKRLEEVKVNKFNHQY
ncbi:UNKNOWN [Stylonychia lemnae]|uniref:GRIP domain-containing protein n=1 Tax=Stylonychia lemnae TaxID=5949 RepID=A0A078ABQ0_STYLE|nr:UNKNOWN [Stylonychia lemnae]|eukprot:CDW78208.1 UNKNOWN [Stylonychia lemnae]